MKKANLIMLGAPGSGKGTRAVALCEVLGIVQVSTGDLFRYNIKQDTELGKLAKSYINKGELVPDDVTAAMVKDRLKNPDTANGFILDGFPRTIAQAEMLDKILEELGEKISYVIYLNVPDSEIIRRISGRLICSDCQTPYHKEFKLYTRDDDKPETVQKRLEVFRSTTFPLVDYYKSRGILVEIPPELSEKGAVSDMRELVQKLGLIGK